MSRPKPPDLDPPSFAEATILLGSGGPSQTWSEDEQTVRIQATSLPTAQLEQETLEDGRPRYEDLGLLGRGGMGEVRRVRDHALRRVVAMKIVTVAASASPTALARFVAEAQATAQLQHPGIVPVHEVGRLADGRPFFTMQEVHGSTLTRVIESAQQARRSGASGADAWSLHRLVEAFHRVCETIAFAHSRGVLHRDLKPDNIMVGAFGEVLVLDWGVAAFAGGKQAAGERAGLEEESTQDEDSPPISADQPWKTRLGAVTGTPAYMAPEQAWGSSGQVDPRTDVYALGAVLYQLLSGRAPYDRGSAREVLEQVRRAPPQPLAERCEVPVPAELVEITERAMARDPSQRHPTARELARELAGWLEGAQRRQRALERVDRAESLAPQAALLRGRARRDRQAAEDQLAELPRWAGEAAKAPAWTLEEQAEELERQADQVEHQVDQLLQGALSLDPTLPQAHAFLARGLQDRHAQAELLGDRRAAERVERRLRVHTRALPPAHPQRLRHEAWLAGRARLSLRSDPAGAEVLLFRYASQHGRLQPVFDRSLGRTPLDAVELSAGSVVLVLRAPGRAPLRLPVELARGEHLDFVPPDQAAPVMHRLPHRGELAVDERLVPAGWSWLGGGGNGWPLRRFWSHALVVRRFPVTNREYLVFLDDLVDRGREAEALRAAPRLRSASIGEDAPIVLGRDPRGRFLLQADEDGDIWLPDNAIMMVDLEAALAHARWEAARTGLSWRLPGELEWVHFARGADRRSLPWGYRYDEAWAAVRYCAPGRFVPLEVQRFPRDKSPLGVRCLAGGVEEWTLRPHEPRPPSLVDGRAPLPELPTEPLDPTRRYVTRGGHWSTGGFRARVNERSSRPAGLRASYLGYRLVRPWS